MTDSEYVIVKGEPAFCGWSEELGWISAGEVSTFTRVDADYFARRIRGRVITAAQLEREIA